MLVVAAFRVSIGWGLAYLFLPFAQIVFLFKHWQEARRGFWLNLFGALLLCGALFSTPPPKRNLVKGAPAAVKQPPVEKEKPGDLNTQIERKRAQIDEWETQFQKQGAALAQQYQALNARRNALNASDAAAVTDFNAQATAYSQANAALKQLRQQIDDAQRELADMLDQRSRQKTGRKPGASNTRTVTFAQAPAAPAAPARRSSGAVVIFSTSHCPWCSKAKEYFARKGVQYEERDIERSSAASDEFHKLGGRGVPLIMVGSEKIDGFDQKRLDQLL